MMDGQMVRWNKWQPNFSIALTFSKWGLANKVNNNRASYWSLKGVCLSCQVVTLLKCLPYFYA